MPTSSSSLVASLILAVSLVTAVPGAQANGGTYVFINGYELTPQELYATEQQIGARIAPGNYLYNANTGCWSNLSNGDSGCLGNGGNGSNGSYVSRYGSGEWNSNGDWNHWSNAAGGAVGGTGDGCIYTTFGWSNC
jgi:hypothetical protein